MKNRILILDLDGVLITTPKWKSDDIHTDGYSEFNESCIQNLNELFKLDKFEIWLSSTRRTTKTVDEFNTIFKNRGVNKLIKGFLPLYSGCSSREAEITKFIQENKLTKYLIIDDDKSLNEASTEIKDKTVLTELMLGFNTEKLTEAERIITEDGSHMRLLNAKT